MAKVRLVEITARDGVVYYQIQQKHWLLRWKWVGANKNSFDTYVKDTFINLEDAERNLCWYDGTKERYKVLIER